MVLYRDASVSLGCCFVSGVSMVDRRVGLRPMSRPGSKHNGQGSLLVDRGSYTLYIT